jgi:hypothetical protein
MVRLLHRPVVTKRELSAIAFLCGLSSIEGPVDLFVGFQQGIEELIRLREKNDP